MCVLDLRLLLRRHFVRPLFGWWSRKKSLKRSYVCSRAGSQSEVQDQVAQCQFCFFHGEPHTDADSLALAKWEVGERLDVSLVWRSEPAGRWCDVWSSSGHAVYNITFGFEQVTLPFRVEHLWFREVLLRVMNGVHRDEDDVTFLEPQAIDLTAPCANPLKACWKKEHYAVQWVPIDIKVEVDWVVFLWYTIQHVSNCFLKNSPVYIYAANFMNHWS